MKAFGFSNGVGGAHEGRAFRVVDQGWLGGRGMRGDDAAGTHDDCPAAAAARSSAGAGTGQPAGPPPNPNAAATAADHRNMMEQLGITALRPGPSGNESAPNHANYDEALANPYPDLPDVLTLKNGRKVTTAAMWWKQRRPEIVEDFDREVLGRVPKNVPKVTWTVDRTETVHRRRPRRRRQATRRPGRQLRLPGDHRRHSDDGGDAGRRGQGRCR